MGALFILQKTWSWLHHLPVFWRLWDGETGKDRRETSAVPVPGEVLVNEPFLPGNTAMSFKSWHVSSAACCGCCLGF